MELQVVAEGIRFSEGPVWCPDGSLVVTSVADAQLVRVDVDSGATSVLCTTGGGANSCALASDGGFLITQNGGIDYRQWGFYADDPPVFTPVTPGLERMRPDGGVTYLLDQYEHGGFHAPNDLVVAADGTVWFTDPPHHPPPPDPIGRVWSWRSGEEPRLVASGFHYCNGIALDPDGTPVVVEANGLMRLGPDGEKEWITEQVGAAPGDGFCVDADGRYYVARTVDYTIGVLDRDGTEVDSLSLAPLRRSADPVGLVTNCCFGGPDLRTLFVTDAIAGRVVAFEGLPTAGLPQHAWPAPG